MNPEFQKNLLEKFPFLTERNGTADHFSVNCPPENLITFVTALRDKFGFDMLTDIAGCDWNDTAPRFGAIYHFVNTSKSEYLRVACNAINDTAPTLPSLVTLYPSANWFEREAFDMVGIKFENHPDLRRILMWENFPYHPLRKDFPLAGKDTDLPNEDQVPDARLKIKKIPMEGGPFTAVAGNTMHQREPQSTEA